jgi:CheY-like chemotaxis protein
MAAPLLRQRTTAASDLRVLDILEKSAARGSALVRQILGFVQGAGGGLRLTQVKHLLRDVSDVIRASFPKSIVLDERTSNDLWPIQANPTQIHQILLNLSVNARDAMLPGGGTLRLHSENLLLSERDTPAVEGARPGPFLVLEVGDTGTGMTPEVLARIWEPFYTTKGEGKGTGLGLSTVRGIAAAHGGFVTVDTRVGHGTTFRVYLPADKTAEISGVASVKPSIPRGHNELILVVDDEPDVCHVAAAILTQHGYRVLTCYDGVEAIALFTQYIAEIQVVISDINMPNLDGAALAVLLRRMRPDVRILTITGFDTSDSEHTPEPGGLVATVSKPFTVDTLLTALHQLLHGGLPAARV